jgi:hypothetical protein
VREFPYKKLLKSLAISGNFKLEVPTVYKAYYQWPKLQGISPQNMAKHMALTYLQFRILKFPLKTAGDSKSSKALEI